MADKTTIHQSSISRRDLLKRLGKSGACYTAPAVIALLSTNYTLAHGMANPTSYTDLNDCKNDAAAGHTMMSMIGMHCRRKHGL